MDEGPGVSLPLLEQLLSRRPQPGDVQDLLAAARERYRDPHVVDQLMLWQMSVVTAADRRRIERERVQLWLTEAEKSEGMVRMLHLETAARHAETVGGDLRSLVSSRLQSAATGDLGLRRISADFSLPATEVENYLAQFTSADTLEEALDIFAEHPPITGDFEANQKSADEIDVLAPLQASLSRTRLGADGLPRWRAETEEDRQDARLARHEELRAQISGGLLAEGLSRIGGHYPPASQEQLVEHFRRRPTLANGTPEVLASCFRLYWAREFTAAAYPAVPLIEALARTILLRASRGVYVVQRKRIPGKYPSLGFLLKELRDIGLDPSWFRYLWTVFASPAGLNMRNEMAHGFLGTVGPTGAAAALHAASFLTLVQVTGVDDEFEEKS